ncbi:rhomboid family intramembrane serine protease [Homoserinimonas sp. OAct 916]|uniref:rhomboid family intramembrane serine protease n=1 Tax=Homoserinimonas sp. OAct 916 TaxID=2211450 RepID=UPI001E65B045|nr:rhomboid family intramembrane serine protease [Homoserinimonas sp. OAct 916]
MSYHPVSGAEQRSANFCYRHPNRQSFILCQRCGRTICPECQTQAAVGVICPECMREQRASAPRTKPAILTRVAGEGKPVVTYSIIALCVFLYILQWIPGLGVTNALIYAPAFSDPNSPYSDVSFQPWRMITATFLHSTGFIFHLLLNMYMLWIFGRILETLLGRGRYLALYLLSGLGGSVAVMLLAPVDQFVLGASGAIFGLVGAFVVIQHRMGGNMTQLLVLVGINLVIGFIPNLNIAWQAHVGGLMVGALIGYIYLETRTPSNKRIQILGVSAVAVVLLLISFSKALF